MEREGHSHSVHTWHFSYVWEHLDVGYVQGMCDLLAPLLVILDEGKRWGVGLPQVKLGSE